MSGRSLLDTGPRDHEGTPSEVVLYRDHVDGYPRSVKWRLPIVVDCLLLHIPDTNTDETQRARTVHGPQSRRSTGVYECHNEIEKTELLRVEASTRPQATWRVSLLKTIIVEEMSNLSLSDGPDNNMFPGRDDDVNTITLETATSEELHYPTVVYDGSVIKTFLDNRNRRGRLGILGERIGAGHLLEKVISVEWASVRASNDEAARSLAVALKKV
eukprot:CAMPEP_0194028954 /NCGR_PEP_ID=MMETSP0009_2-20130614/2820_1 /TAXON_ID=210454 /ORGANISM="Grammatophora oceanica, Strain CCMP 410" /LENGTH=214 /DNA_ID=CAMNT_0038668501 /DNA_START=2988 /DNA_END=3632 /DNA_ORIENTATION=+